MPFGSPPAAAQSAGPKVSVVPWFISTMDHSDFSHGITSDFALRLIRPATQLRRVGPYEISRGNAENFPTAPPAHTLLCPGAPSISFAPIVQARHHLDRADRFANFSATARCFASNPSDPTSRQAPCPAPLISPRRQTTITTVPCLPTTPSEALPPPSATDPAWGRSDWTFTS